MKLVAVIFIYVSFGLIIFSCTKDKVSEVEGECEDKITYLEHIRPIMDFSCAYTGCHVGGSAPGDFSSYSGIANFIEGEQIERRVVMERNMPPNNAAEGRRTLSDSEVNLFKCWIEEGYPEK